MSTNSPCRTRRCAATVPAVIVLAVITSAQLPVCVGQELPPPATAAPAESLPQPESSQLNGPAIPDACKPAPVDNPPFALTVDIRPRTADGKLVAAENLPFNCAGLKPVQQRVMSTDLSCDTCYPGHCDVLSLARFCHRPLYFNDDCLERCGVEQCCCQPCASAMCFYGGALLMPIRAFYVCPCSCVPSGGCCP